MSVVFRDLLRLDRFLLAGPFPIGRGDDTAQAAYPLPILPNLCEGEVIELGGTRSTLRWFDRPYADYHAVDLSPFALEGQKLLLFAKVFCPREEEVVLRVGNLCYAKIWLGRQLVMSERVHLNDGHFALCRLKKGENLITAEIRTFSDEYLKDSPASFSVRINRAPRLGELREGTESLFDDFVNCCVRGRIHIAQNGWNRREGDYRFCVVPKDSAGMDLEQSLQVECYDLNEQKIAAWQTHFGQTNTLRLGALRNNPACCAVRIRIAYQNAQGMRWEERAIQVGDFSSKVSDLKRRVQPLLPSLEEQLRINVEARLRELSRINEKYTMSRQIEWITMDAFLAYYRQVEQLIETAQKGCSFSCYVKQQGCLSVFYRSALDQTDEMYTISLPPGYDPSKAYPVVFFVSMRRYSWYSRFFHAHYRRRDAIFVDISQRGYTLGSYIGEAALLEIMDRILQEYAVDRDRVYLVGYTTGGYAAWALLEAYPDRFAAAVVIGGLADPSCLCNLAHLPLVHLSGDGDKFRTFFDRAGQLLQAASAYRPCILPQADDNTLEYALLSFQLMDWLLTHRRKTPHTWTYRTVRSRHTGAYGVHLLDVERQAPFAQVSARLEGHRLSLYKTETSALTVVPPSGVSLPLEVVLENQVQTLHHAHQSLRYEAGHWQSEVPVFRRCMPAFWGTGLMELFCHPVRIYLAKDFLGMPPKTYEKIVRRFSHPVTTGYEKEVYVSYPVTVVESADQIPLEKGIGYLSFGLYDSSEHFEHCRIHMDEMSIYCAGQRIQGSYCVYQIHEEKGAVLLSVNANDMQCLRRHILSRTFFLPSYASGPDRLLNADAVVLLNGAYYYLPSSKDHLLPLEDEKFQGENAKMSKNVWQQK